MSTVTLKRLQITNFKGIRHLEVSFGKETCIYGDNATGKTTVFDAFTWVLFGKDSTDRKDFGIKPLNEAGKTIDKMENEVCAWLVVGGQDYAFRRVHRENWVKKRGALTEEFDGNETVYFINDVPQKASEYKAKVDSIISEDVFKLITNPLYFNTVLKWEQRRKTLLDIAGEISHDEIIAQITTPDNAERIAQLKADLYTEQSIRDAKARISTQKKRIKDELVNIPARIDEAFRSMPDVPNYAQIEAQIAAKQGEILTIEKRMDDLAAANNEALKAIRDKQAEKHQLQVKLQILEDNRKSEEASFVRNHEARLRHILQEIERVQGDIDANRAAINKFNGDINRLNETNDALREQWIRVNAETLLLDPFNFQCPTCKQQLPEGDKAVKEQEYVASFNNDKQLRLAKISSDGEYNKSEIERLSLIVAKRKNENDTQQATLNDLKSQLEAAKTSTPVQQNTNPTQEEIELEKQIADFVIPEMPIVDTAELKAKRNALADEISDLKAQLSVKDQITQLNARIDQLSGQERDLSQKMADLEHNEFIIDAYQKAKMARLQDQINGRFKYAKFKLFETQINGQEVPACETTYGGVPFGDLNTAGTIQVGIDIINTLADHYGVRAPIFVDNKESVVKLPETQSQLICLVVSEADKKLRVETMN